MLRKMSSVFWVCVLLVFLVPSVYASNQPSAPEQAFSIDTVDGEQYSPKKHKKIAGIVVEKNNQGVKVQGFSTLEKYNAYTQQESFTKPIDRGTKSGIDYFYEHTSGQGYGNYRTLSSGQWSYNVGVRWGTSWNDRISSLSVAPWSWVTLFQHDYYGGYYITFKNYSSYRLFANLTSFKMPNGKTWNDQVTSIKTGNY